MAERSAGIVFGKRLIHNPTMDPKYIWRMLHSELLLDTPCYRITRDRLVHPHGHELDYYVIHNRRRAAGVVPVGADGRLLLVQQWRHPVQKLLWGIPAGGIEPGEEPIEAARRELQEETGYRADQMTRLHVYHPSVGVSDQMYYLFVATGLVPVAKPDGGEIHQIGWFTLAEIEQLIDGEEGMDGLSLTGLLLYIRRCHNHFADQQKDDCPMG